MRYKSSGSSTIYLMKARKVVRWAGLLLPAAGFAILFLISRPQPPPVNAAEGGPAPRTPRALSAQVPLPAVFARFADWADNYTATPAQGRNSLQDSGLELARERRTELKKLIETDPRRALELAVPFGVRDSLPQAVKALLEERVSGRGELALLAALPEPGRETEVKPNFRTATIGNKRYEAFVYGRRANHLTMRNVSLNGVAIDDVLAVNENPVRVMDAAEAAAARNKKMQEEVFCAISGDETTSKGTETVVEVDGTAVFLCSDLHVEDLNQRLVAAEGIENPAGASGEDPLPSAYTEGVKRLIFIRVDFSDLAGGPFSDSAGLTLLTNMANYWAEASYGKTTVSLPDSDMTPVFRMPNTAAYYGNNNFYDQLRADARAAADAAGYLRANYEFDIICIGAVPGFGWGGLGYVGAPGAWIRNTSSTGTTAHELGHNLGLNHASFWDTSGQSIIGPGTRIEYGDNFDTMGSGGSGRHYNARYRVLLNWLTATDWITLTSNGVYRLNAYDVTNSTGIRAMRVIKTSSSATNTYWLEFRQKSTNTKWATNGVSLRWAGSGNQRSQLLDTTPGSPSGKDDSALVIGRTFSDTESGIHITVLGKGGTTPQSIDIAYNRGTFPANLDPLIAITASATNTSAGVQLTFTAAASDPDADPLAYYWDFGNGDFGTNNATVRYAFATAGEYLVRCTASDMKGGIASDSIIVRVGTPTTYRISGRIARPDGTPIEGVRVFASSTRVTYTDSDGNYNLVALPAGSYTMNAVLEDFAFTHPAFGNPVSVGPNASNIDFIGGPPGGESLIALVPAGAEWKYLDDGSNQGNAWTNINFGDQDWNQGPAQLGYGDADEATVVGFGTNSNSKYITTYFRHQFYIEDPTDFATLTLGLLRDDGAIVYLNGREVRRDNIAASGVIYTTRALAAVDNADESTFFESSVDPTWLRAGTNLLAVEIHQSSSTSSDISFDVFLNALAVTNLPRGVFLTSPANNATLIGPTNILVSANASAGPAGSIARVEFYEGDNLLGQDTSLPYSIVWSNAPVGTYDLTARAYDNSSVVLTSTPVHLVVSALLVSRGATWRFLDTGTESAGWNTQAFNDATWRSGRARLGYGGDGELTTVGYGPSSTTKYITTWFRHWFNVPAQLSVTSLLFRLQRDDGAVIYLNGAELYRSNMPDTPINSGTPASSTVDNADETTFFETRIDLPPITAGASNLVAVEIHQVLASSSDIGFDLEILGIGSFAQQPPSLSIARSGSDLRLSWPASAQGWALFSSTTLGPDADWTEVAEAVQQIGGQYTVTVTPGSSRRFFQLRR
jgi:hypothetical protein